MTGIFITGFKADWDPIHLGQIRLDYQDPPWAAGMSRAEILAALERQRAEWKAEREQRLGSPPS